MKNKLMDAIILIYFSVPIVRAEPTTTFDTKFVKMVISGKLVECTLI